MSGHSKAGNQDGAVVVSEDSSPVAGLQEYVAHRIAFHLYNSRSHAATIGKQQLEQWTQTKYQQPSDEYDESWDLRGAVEEVRLLYYVGLQVAEQSELPQWNPGDEFEAARKAAVDALPK